VGVVGSLDRVAIVRLFASAREAAGTGRAVLPGDTVDAVLAAARDTFGEAFVAVLPSCRIWLNGDAVDGDTPVGERDEVAVLPPVSGG
jgi:molybdopterin converting factor small subunit